MKKESVWLYIGFILLVTIVGGGAISIIRELQEGAAAEKACTKSCGIVRSTRINDECFCKTLIGWEKAHL